jgi:hypothetical protein
MLSAPFLKTLKVPNIVLVRENLPIRVLNMERFSFSFKVDKSSSHIFPGIVTVDPSMENFPSEFLRSEGSPFSFKVVKSHFLMIVKVPNCSF